MARIGRPTKYKGEVTCRQVLAIAELLKSRPEAFLQHCGVEQVAHDLGIHKDTIYEWVKTYPAFSDSLKRWQMARDSALYQLARSLPPAVWIFMMKNMMGWGDKSEVEHKGKVEQDGKLIVEVVDIRKP